MITINGRIIYSVLFVSLSMFLVFLIKPELIFDQNEEIKAFGLKKQETLFSLGVFTTLVAILSFYFFAIVDLIFS
tara:strand:- start:512 stop:736 length:225 start_codon:yes stop_codon:yes gene_type:complete